jgi:hypothetical protein
MERIEYISLTAFNRNYREGEHDRMGQFPSSKSHSKQTRLLFVFVFPTRAANLDVQNKTTQTHQKLFRKLTIDRSSCLGRKTPTRQDLMSGKARSIMDGAGEGDLARRLITRRGRLSVSEYASAFPILLYTVIPFLFDCPFIEHELIGSLTLAYRSGTYHR